MVNYKYKSSNPSYTKYMPLGILHIEDQEEYEAQQKQLSDELTADKIREDAEQAEQSDYEHAHEVALDNDITE